MISALLLGNAGVSPDDVAADYAESVRAMAGAKTHAPTHDRQALWSVAQADQWIAETASIVREAAANAHVVLDAIGLSADEQKRLRTLLTKA